MLADAGQHILKIAPGGLVIQHLDGCDTGQAVTLGPLAQAGFLGGLLRAPVPRHEGVEPIAEGVVQVVGYEDRIG